MITVCAAKWSEWIIRTESENMFRNFKFFAVLLNCVIFWDFGIAAELRAYSNELTTPIVEYYFEHEVTEKDARKVIADFVENGKSAKRPPYCDECTSEDKLYCNSRAFISDHCCCDHRHGRGESNTHSYPWQRGKIIKRRQWIFFVFFINVK